MPSRAFAASNPHDVRCQRRIGWFGVLMPSRAFAASNNVPHSPPLVTTGWVLMPSRAFAASNGIQANKEPYPHVAIGLNALAGVRCF